MHRLAEREIDQAFRFYSEQASRRVALHFLEEFERVIRLLEASPGLGTPLQEARSVFPFRAYPYSVIYRAVDGGIRILAVRHQRRAPEDASRRS